jgi:hypothetical protein
MNKEHDIVYILKDGIQPHELIYSLRTVEKNMPHRKVWFIGGCPEGVRPDVMIKHEQKGGSKWERVRSSLIEICKNPDLSEKFFLFNDDFFVLKERGDKFINYTDGTIARRTKEIIKRSGRSQYTNALQNLSMELAHNGHDTISFAVHMPMLINKHNMLSVLQNRKYYSPMFRSLYGNVCQVPYIYHKDCKIYDMVTVPDDTWAYVSTTEQSFEFGAVGQWIREKYNKPSRYEI